MMDVKFCSLIVVISRKFPLDPKPESIWSGLPIWMLALLQWITGLLIATMLAAITALFWPVAAIYYHAIFRSHKTVQAILAVTGFIAAIIFYPLVFAILLIIAMVLWVLWIIKDAAAIEAHSIRPKIGPEYLLGLPVFAD